MLNIALLCYKASVGLEGTVIQDPVLCPQEHPKTVLYAQIRERSKSFQRTSTSRLNDLQDLGTPATATAAGAAVVPGGAPVLATIAGVTSRPELNGREARVLTYLSHKGRYKVELSRSLVDVAGSSLNLKSDTVVSMLKRPF